MHGANSYAWSQLGTSQAAGFNEGCVSEASTRLAVELAANLQNLDQQQ